MPQYHVTVWHMGKPIQKERKKQIDEKMTTKFALHDINQMLLVYN